MATTGRRAGRKSGRVLDWHVGVSVFDQTVKNVPQNIPLVPTIITGETVTIMRIVGNVSFAPDVDQLEGLPASPGHIDSSIQAGIQVVNRVIGSAGAARDPAVLDDREGREWMWRMTYRRTYAVTRAVDNPPDWFMPVHGEGADPTRIDIRVKRKIDLSQDEIVFSHTHKVRSESGNLTGLEYFAHVDLRVLLLR